MAATDDYRSAPPTDLAAVARDDAFIDAIASGGSVPTDSEGEYELGKLLAQWRDDIVSAPMPPAPPIDQIVAGMLEARPPARPRARRFGLWSAAAAVVVAFAAGGALSYQAEPGSPLWSVKAAVFSAKADQTVEKQVRGKLDTAQALLKDGDRAAVSSQLEQARAELADVQDDQLRAELQTLIKVLEAAVGQMPSQPVPTESVPVMPPPPPSSGPAAPPAPGNPQQPPVIVVPAPPPSITVVPPTAPVPPTTTPPPPASTPSGEPQPSAPPSAPATTEPSQPTGDISDREHDEGAGPGLDGPAGEIGTGSVGGFEPGFEPGDGYGDDEQGGGGVF